MNIQDETRAMTAKLRSVGVTDLEFCQQAEIDKGTWVRWKRGVGPKLETWIRAVNKFNAIIDAKATK